MAKHLSGLLREAMDVRRVYHRGEAEDFVAESERLRRQTSYHLHARSRELRFLDGPLW